MKKLLLVILLCLLPILSWASGPQVLATGTCTRDNMRLSTIAGTAFWQCNGVDISAFAGEYIELRDTAKKVLRGFAKAAGGGLAYGSDKDVDGITKANPGVVTLAASSAITDGMCVYFSSLTEMTDLNTKYRTVKGTSGDTFQLESTSGYAAAETTGGNCLKQLTVPAATGVTIVNTKGGTTYNWAFTESGFNVNDSSYTYRILSSNIPGKQIASGTVTASNVKLATVDGGAMVEITGVDLSPYAGNDTGGPVTIINPKSTSAATMTTNKYLLCLYGSGVYVGAAGGGEGLGGELSDTWTNKLGFAYETFTAGAGSAITQAVNTSSYGIAYKAYTFTSGALYKIGGTVTLASGTNPDFYFASGTVGDSPYLKIGTGTLTNVYKTAQAAYTYLNIWNSFSAGTNGDWGLADFTVKQVTDIATTGVHLHSTANGTDRKMRLNTCNPNAITSYRLYKTY